MTHTDVPTRGETRRKMKPINFQESNATLTKPQGMTDKECGPLPIYRDLQGICVSCWRPTFREALAVLFRRRIWLWIWSGATQPPVCLGTESPFKNFPK